MELTEILKPTGRESVYRGERPPPGAGLRYKIGPGNLPASTDFLHGRASESAERSNR